MPTLTYHGCGHHWTIRTDCDEHGAPVAVEGWCYVTMIHSTAEALAARARRCIDGLANWAKNG